MAYGDAAPSRGQVDHSRRALLIFTGWPAEVFYRSELMRLAADDGLVSAIGLKAAVGHVAAPGGRSCARLPVGAISCSERAIVRCS